MTNPCLHHVWYLKYLRLLSLFWSITYAVILQNSFHLSRLPSPLPLVDLLPLPRTFKFISKGLLHIFIYIYTYKLMSILKSHFMLYYKLFLLHLKLHKLCSLHKLSALLFIIMSLQILKDFHLVEYFGNGSVVVIYKNVILTRIKMPVAAINTKLTDVKSCVTYNS